MPAVNQKQLSPAVQVGDKLVRVGTLTWGGIKAVQQEFSNANLPLPKLAIDSIGEAFGDIQAMFADARKAGDEVSAALAGQAANAKLWELGAKVLADNLPTVIAWITGHPPIVTALAQHASNLSPEEIDQLSAGQLMRVAKAAWDEIVADGFFTGAAGFFGGLVGLKVKQAPDTSDSQSQANPASPSSQSSPSTQQAPSGEASASAST